MMELRADCGRCVGLCCVGPGFAASADFAITKPAGRPCPNLRADFRCAVHDRLKPAGFPGCAAYDCFGAGQHVAQGTFEGRDWRRHPELGEQMFAAFAVMRQLHELLWYLREALGLDAAGPLRAELGAAQAEIERLTGLGPDALAEVDAAECRRGVADLLRRVSELVRGAGVADLAGADLAGKDLRGADLRRASLRGAVLIGADLRGADLRLTDVLGADFRGAGLRGADLSATLFLVQSQLGAAADTRDAKLPPTLGY